MSPLRVAYLLDRYPVLSETFIANELTAVLAEGIEVSVEVHVPPEGDPPPGAPGVVPRYRELDPPRRRAAAMAWLALRHPLACAKDLVARRRWARDEWVPPLRHLAPVARRLRRDRVSHLHAHFAGAAALDALRIGALLGRPYSVTAHAYDIFMRPRNLVEKLTRARFAMTVCEYNARHLRTVAPDARLHTMVMGVDGEAFRRTRPHRDGRTVVAVGRLVEKKGFDDLIAAAGLLAGRPASELERVRIIGDGPLLAVLEAQIAELGLGDVVELLGPRPPAEVRAVLEAADLLAMPCVVAADGDRDSMPVVVKEALAMEIPVVGTDEVGVPEMVHDGWGRLVAPGDPAALAGAIAALLALSAERRHGMGAAGRAFVLEHCDLNTETRRLTALLRGSPQAPGVRSSE